MFFNVREENDDDEETSRMWNGTIFRPVLEEVLLKVGWSSKGG
jgi:hypothetical protein